MKLLVYTLNIIAGAPLLLVLPLAPFTFLLLDGEGTIPGLLQERIFHTLMITYPVIAVVCVFFSIRWFRQQRIVSACSLTLLPIFLFTLLTLIFLHGGIQLR